MIAFEGSAPHCLVLKLQYHDMPAFAVERRRFCDVCDNTKKMPVAVREGLMDPLYARTSPDNASQTFYGNGFAGEHPHLSHLRQETIADESFNHLPRKRILSAHDRV